MRQAPGALVQLIDGGGRVTQEARTGFDGFFLFQKVPLCVYRIRVPEGEPPRGGVVAAERAAVLTAGHPVASGVDWIFDEPPPR